MDVLDAMTEITNITEDIAKYYPIDDSAFLTGMLLQGAKWEDSNSDAPRFFTEMVNKEIDPKIPVVHVFAIKLKINKLWDIVNALFII